MSAGQIPDEAVVQAWARVADKPDPAMTKHCEGCLGHQHEVERTESAIVALRESARVALAGRDTAMEQVIGQLLGRAEINRRVLGSCAPPVNRAALPTEREPEHTKREYQRAKRDARPR